MENDGQAQEAPGTLDDAAAFLMDSGVLADDEPLDEDNSDVEEHPIEGESGPDEEEEADSDEEEEESPEPEQTSQKFKVTIKGEDGADETVEVDQQELIAGYQRQSRFTQLAQGLADRERQAAEVVQRQLNEGRNYFYQEAQMARQAVLALAGIRSEDEMAQLATQNPSEWVAERQRQAYVQNVIANIDAKMNAQRQQAEQEHKHQIQQMSQSAWAVLSKHGIDESKLANIFTSFSKQYGIDRQAMTNVYDPNLILAMQDAVAYKALKDKTVPAKTPQKAAQPGKRTVPTQTQKTRQNNARFTKGQAKLRDLASFIQSNS